jgi:hypothetical protein
MLARILLPLAFIAFALNTSIAVATPTLETPATAQAGSVITFTVTNPANPRDFVTVVPKTTQEGSYQAYVYVAQGGQLKLDLPPEPGDYELRLLSANSPYPTLVKKPLKIEAAKASLEAPAQVSAGAEIEIKWTGPANERDFVGLGDSGRPYYNYAYTRDGKTLKLTAPDKAGTYELRYFLGVGNKVIASRPITVTGNSAKVTVPASIAAGANLKITWEGPNNPRDFITIVKAGTPERQYKAYAYTSTGNPVQILAPDQAGDYEVRYLTAQSYMTLASAKISVTSVNATVKGPASAVAGGTFTVNWTGPNNARDFINIVPKGTREGDSGGWSYTDTGNPVTMRAPIAPGEYELRYSTGQSYATLASAPIQITPGKEEPGLVAVQQSSSSGAGNAVEIILDASGSMLQKIGAQRRIDIAKQTLTTLSSSIIPAGTPFAMRVFGREVDSCQTDLFMPLSPLDGAAASGQIAKLEAKNGAKTPIGASLAKVADDLASVKGERLVVLLTDGEETCDGDPAAEIAKLQKAGLGVRVNIVGFAIDDRKLAVTFRQWASTGNGAFFEANDAAGHSNAMAQAMRPGFEVVDAKGQVVAEGVVGADPVKAMPGSYSVRLKGQKAAAQPVTVKAKETATVRF